MARWQMSFCACRKSVKSCDVESDLNSALVDTAEQPPSEAPRKRPLKATSQLITTHPLKRAQANAAQPLNRSGRSIISTGHAEHLRLRSSKAMMRATRTQISDTPKLPKSRYRERILKHLFVTQTPLSSVESPRRPSHGNFNQKKYLRQPAFIRTHRLIHGG